MSIATYPSFSQTAANVPVQCRSSSSRVVGVHNYSKNQKDGPKSITNIIQNEEYTHSVEIKAIQNKSPKIQRELTNTTVQNERKGNY